ncbi:hypothetical protein [Flammeovirga kamogawensis]|nr:hypothetical protein [Flammeovirga kamogawensis]MBB6461714.1 hypothetical protein [Flammeovirga kamogawensis]
MQKATKNEVSGFFLDNRVMVILPNNENSTISTEDKDCENNSDC